MACRLDLQGLHKRFGQRVTAADLSLTVEPGEFFTTLGPSGSGKSTVLRMIAGLERPDAGRILLDGEDITTQPPWRRRLGMVFQHYANFPHLDVAQNVAYGLRRRAWSKAAVTARVEELLGLVGLAGFGRRRVATLSGGEQQRVAIARALAPKPRLLLLDEPLSALDEPIRREMQALLKTIQRATATTFVYVTHDQEEALALSDRVALLHRGEVIQCGPPQELYRRPRSRFAAGFVRGSNPLGGEIPENGAEAVFQGGGLAIPLGQVAEPPPPPGPVWLAVRGEDLRLGPTAGASPVTFTAAVAGVTYRGLFSEWQLTLADGQTLVALDRGEAPHPLPAEVQVGLDPRHVVLLEDDLVPGEP
ncbi:MAG: ABC transporter ATP-binding protein [Candidatus Competibacterales bacterium]